MFAALASPRARTGLVCALFVGVTFTATSLIAADRDPPAQLFVKLAEDQPMPVIEARATKDAAGDWTVAIDAENFRFIEICKTVTGREAVGHVHIYEGNRKLASAYAPEKSIGQLAPGRHELTITLQATDHRAFVTEAGMITAKLVIDA